MAKSRALSLKASSASARTAKARASSAKAAPAKGDAATVGEPKKGMTLNLLKGLKSTADISVPKLMVDQVIGQEKAVSIIRKEAKQKRNVLLIGEPGTGKSLMAQA